MSTIAIIPGAGQGSRFNSEKNKIFHTICGKPVVAYVFEVLQKLDIIDEIIPVLRDCDIRDGELIIEKYVISKVKKIAPGGLIRQQSVLNAIKLIDDKNACVVIHDGARPFVSPELVTGCINALNECDGVVAAVNIKDTVKKVKDNLFVEKTLKRQELMAVQTPQVFRFGTIYNAYERALNDNLEFTDDTSAVEHYGGRIKIVPSFYGNIKITTKEDMDYAEFIVSRGGFSR
ncbi:2-C-methyl-D-erythritol 4-phosphate cytidylyltransferase [Candidatus Magnetomonas plexicatena]|uniref:2-C-methyl-D-erythritol 4-phosphate cytidylyltransferase n=1 Tax=Candidatus Magnetomonas plexicatena TaxID=2552947 RepID=UPI001C7853E4|nr:2-C-methyl-D-erythritol 4-phosphate cytidylyltransferase [Nitrospirales bacterium LBB_01]